MKTYDTLIFSFIMIRVIVNSKIQLEFQNCTVNW